MYCTRAQNTRETLNTEESQLALAKTSGHSSATVNGPTVPWYQSTWKPFGANLKAESVKALMSAWVALISRLCWVTATEPDIGFQCMEQGFVNTLSTCVKEITPRVITPQIISSWDPAYSFMGNGLWTLMCLIEDILAFPVISHVFGSFMLSQRGDCSKTHIRKWRNSVQQFKKKSGQMFSLIHSHLSVPELHRHVLISYILYFCGFSPYNTSAVTRLAVSLCVSPTDLIAWKLELWDLSEVNDLVLRWARFPRSYRRKSLESQPMRISPNGGKSDGCGISCSSHFRGKTQHASVFSIFSLQLSLPLRTGRNTAWFCTTEINRGEKVDPMSIKLKEKQNPLSTSNRLSTNGLSAV